MHEFDTYPAGDFSGTNVANSFVVEAKGRISLNSGGLSVLSSPNSVIPH